MTGKSRNGSPSFWPLIRMAVVAIVLVAGVQVGTFLTVRYYLIGWAERGQFGDIFGATNAFFSGLAFAALIYTITLQQRQLDLQGQDLQDQKKASLRANDLSALTILLQHYHKRQEELRKFDETGKGPANLHKEMVDIEAKILRINGILGKIHTELVSREEHR